MNDVNARIIENTKIADGTFMMKLWCDASAIERPGQFINIKLEGFFLRRPLSICSWGQNTLTLIYKVIGKGTKQMSEMEPEDMLDILFPLGNGFDLEEIPDDAVLIAGGAGLPPIYCLAERLTQSGKKPLVALGFKTSEDVYYLDQFRKIGIEPVVDIGGRITDIACKGRYVCACGPEPMLKAAYDISMSGQFSFESRMGCGFGVCRGCTCKTRYGSKQICKDGPVLKKEEIIW